MKISFDELIRMITQEVVNELAKSGIAVDHGYAAARSSAPPVKKSLELDMSGFKTPVLTENTFWDIDKNIKELIVPAKTVITPGAAREIKIRQVEIIRK